jgi:hypothetical protein
MVKYNKLNHRKTTRWPKGGQSACVFRCLKRYASGQPMRRIHAFLICLLFPLPAFPDGVAEDIVELTGIKETYENSYVIQMLTDDVELQVEPGNELYYLYEEHNRKVNALRKNTIAWEAIKPLIIAHYESTFTENELVAWREWLQSDVGRSIVRKEQQSGPVLEQAITEKARIFNKRRMELSRKLQAAVDDFVERLENGK